MHIAPSTATALADPGTPRTVWQWLWHEERIGLPLCLGVTAFLTFSFGGHFWENLVYSLCIGQMIQFSIEAGRYGMGHLLQRHNPQATFQQRQWPGWLFMGPWILACSLGCYVLGMQLGDWLTGNNHLDSLKSRDLRLLGPISVITIAVSAMTTYFFHSRGRLEALAAQAARAEQAAAENQLRLLQSQLEPHMLFNTLANLRVLIALDPPKAQAMLDQLVGFLRATLQASRQSSHPLADEFARVQDYLALMQVRMGERLQVNVDLPEALRAQPVPPLLLQPLVENSIKHGLEPKPAGGRIILSAQRHGAELQLSVLDTGLGLQAPGITPAGTGFGLEQVRNRLATLYGTQARLQVQAAPDGAGGTLATITLPLPA